MAYLQVHDAAGQAHDKAGEYTEKAQDTTDDLTQRGQVCVHLFPRTTSCMVLVCTVYRQVVHALCGRSGNQQLLVLPAEGRQGGRQAGGRCCSPGS